MLVDLNKLRRHNIRAKVGVKLEIPPPPCLLDVSALAVGDVFLASYRPRPRPCGLRTVHKCDLLVDDGLGAS